MKDIKQIIEDKNKEIKEEYKGSVSVSKLNNDFLKKKFDNEAKAKECALKGEKYPDYKYAGMTAEQILESWDAKSAESKRYGSMLDDYAGLRLNQQDDELELWKLDTNYDNDERLQSICLGFDDFYEFITTKTNYKYVARELPLYCKTPKGGKINGRFDCLFYDDKTDGYIIIDWKTTDNITTKNKYNTFLQGPACEMDECDMNLYTVQLHIYKKALVETYGLTSYDKISVYVCNLLRKPENAKYYKLFPQNFTFDVNKINSFIDFGHNKYRILKNIKAKAKSKEA